MKRQKIKRKKEICGKRQATSRYTNIHKTNKTKRQETNLHDKERRQTKLKL